MTTLDLPEPKWRSLSLAPAQRSTRGRRGAAPLKLQGTVDLAEIVTVPLVPDLAGDDTILKHFLQTEGSGFRFHLVRFACGFRPATGEKFERAWLEIGLDRADGASSPRPIAWSMKPERLTKPVEITTKRSLGGKWEIFETSLEKEEKRNPDETFLQAQRVQTHQPFWEFMATPSVPLTGSFVLDLVVRSPAADVTHGKVDFSVVVQRVKYLLFYQEEEVPVSPSLTFDLT